jgi:E3 ubiquitin-protein ligase BRE1
MNCNLQLLNEKEEHLKQINSLLLPKEDGGQGPAKGDIEKSPAFIEMSTKLGTAERRVQELEQKYENTRQRWAVTKGDLELAKKTIAEMEQKHERRWNELLSQFSESDSAPSTNGAKDVFGSAKKIAELESKLQQSVEAVNRMETLRSTLSDSYKMNEALQSKLDDLKSKNAKIMAEKSAARAAQGAEPLASPAAASSSKRASTGSSSGDPSVDKLQRDYKRARKELAAAVMSKDQAKLKQEVGMLSFLLILCLMFPKCSFHYLTHSVLKKNVTP